ncbi:MAG: GspH/FimT family pseudopilin [Azoarcus sp.]|nr:GspH/FimT family pseudopilin [Azoarcus sp.]
MHYSRRRFFCTILLWQRWNKQANGFTLIELLIVVAIATVLSGIAAPSFYEMIRNMALTGAANEITSVLQFARSEALRSNSVLLFTLNENRTWQVIRDVNGNGAHDAGENVLHEGGFSSHINLANSPIPKVTFTPSGIARFNPATGSGGNCRNGDVCICLTAADYPYPRMIRVKKTGRPVIMGGKGSNQANTGNNVSLVCAS